MDGQNKNSFLENYSQDPEILASVARIVSDEMNNSYLAKEQTMFNTHTKELIEGYLNPANKNDAGVGIKDFADKMVLRFMNEHELSLYFETVDQLSKVVILKGQRVLLEKEHYQEIMEGFINLNKDFLMFLCKDEAYGEVKQQKEK